jgi:hypothetical protein
MFRFITLTLLVFGTLTTAAIQAQENVQAVEVGQDELWYVVISDGKRIGHIHQRIERGEERIETGQRVKLAVGRAGAAMTIEIETAFTETHDGKPIQARSKVNLGSSPMVTLTRFQDDGIFMTTGEGTAEKTRKRPLLKHDWLPPAAMQREISRQLEAGATEISIRSVDTSMGITPIEMTMKVIGEEPVEAYGKTVPAIVWDMTVSSAPGITLREYVDENGVSIKSTLQLLPGVEFTILRADKQLALSAVEPTEMIANTLVTPNQPIEKPRETSLGIYRLSLKDGKPLPDLPVQVHQRVIPGEDGRSADVHVDLNARHLGKPSIDESLQASVFIDHEDEQIRIATREAIAHLRQALESTKVGSDAIAKGLRDWVHSNIESKNLSVGFATASDVIRTRQGDCTEHAVLLAAMLRSAKIPARCVSGLVYADQFAGMQGVFGYHMWTQAWLQPEGESAPRWVDLDATLPNGVAFDATHIALSVSNLNEPGFSSDVAVLQPLLGNLKIEVLEIKHHPPADP